MKKVAIIGAGGRVSTTAVTQFTRFPESMGITFSLYDINESSVLESLRIIEAGSAIQNVPLSVKAVSRREGALEDADMVLYGALAAPSPHPPFNLEGTLGNIEVMQGLVQEVLRLAGPVKIINYSNPTDFLGMVIKAMHPEVDMISHCTGGEELKRNLLLLFGVPFEEEDRLTLRHVGGNHFGFVLGVELDGEDVMPRLRSMPFNWREFKGLRQGDSYDLARALSLYRASGILTYPAGHVGFYHGIGCNPGHSPDHGHWRPKKTDMLKASVEANECPEHYWTVMDTWCTRSIAIVSLSYLGLLKEKPFSIQAPNSGFIEGLDDDAFVEAWGNLDEKGQFVRIPVHIPPLLKHMIHHNNLADYRLATAIANQDYEALCQAMMLRGDRSNFHYSIPTLRMFVCDKWGIQDDLDSIYTRDVFEREEDMEFPLMEFEDPIIGNFAP